MIPVTLTLAAHRLLATARIRRPRRRDGGFRPAAPARPQSPASNGRPAARVGAWVARLVAVGGLVLGLAQPAVAAVVFEQAWRVNGSGWASQQELVGPNGDFAKTYDDFSLASDTTLSAVAWTGFYFNPNVQGPLTGFLIEIWADDAGLPGAAPLFSETIAGAAGESFIGTDPVTGYLYYSYRHVLAAAFDAVANTAYWLSIQSLMEAPPQWGWGLSGGGRQVQDFQGVRHVRDSNTAFVLESRGHAVPAPGSLALAGIGLLGAFAARGRARGRVGARPARNALPAGRRR